ncbi:MAG: ABC transporter permease [Myxococcales bacterium]|nr:ABC transporter permease [Myxococcales bacterium]
MKSRIPAIARKETLHILRDWRTLAMAFVLPLILILLFGYAITFDIKHLRLAVADEDQTKASRAFVEKFTASDYFVVTARPAHAAQLPELLRDGTAQVALAIPQDFAKHLEQLRGETVQILVDGAENNTASIAGGYLQTIVGAYNLERVRDLLASKGLGTAGIPPINPEVRIWFNPLVDSATTIVPGLIAVIIILMSAMLTSLTIVRERENGSLEGLIATPVRKHEILVGKIIPYFVIALLDTALIALVGVFVFAVPFNGSVPLFLAIAAVFTFAGLSIGLMASVASSNMMLANQIVLLTTMLPSLLISGFMFPISSMPDWVQAITYLVPARYFIAIARGIMLRAAPLEDLLGPTALLLGVGLLFFARASATFRKKL